MTSLKHQEKENKEIISVLSNPFSTGDGGGDFEHRVQATFLLALLVEGFSPLLNFSIKRVDFQTKRSGYDVDDVRIVSCDGELGGQLLCQIKHGVTIGENLTFKKVIFAAWSDFNKPEFNRRRDRIVLVSGLTPSADSLRFIYDQANGASDAKDFLDRIKREHYSNGTKRNNLNTIRKYLVEANNGEELTDDELWGFCKVFTILVFDMDYESSVNEFLVHTLIASNCRKNAIWVWGKLVDIAARYDRSGKHVALDDIPDNLKREFKNITVDTNATPVALDFSIDLLWAKLALVGAWNEKNEFDRKFLESFFEISYTEIQRKVQENSLQPTPNVFFLDGCWHINHRHAIIKACSRLFFDDTIHKMFELSESILKEKDKRIQENGEFSILMPPNGPFNHSEELRDGVIHGLAMLSNLSTAQLPCSTGLIESKSARIIRNILEGADKTVWMSLDTKLPVIAEINPEEYLRCVERQAINDPECFESLFPQKTSNLLFSRNSIHSILWSLESLAWKEKYFIKCIRLLGLLANLNYEKTNSSNTPMNSIVSIMLPWHPQTLSSKEKQQSAIKVLQEECPKIAWEIIKQLLPHATRMTGGTYQPQYILSGLPKDGTIPAQYVSELYQYYSRLALDLAKEDYSKMCDLLKHYDHMDRDTFIAYLDLIMEKSSFWDDSQKYPFWKEFSDHKDWILHNENEVCEDGIMELIDSTIEKTTPDDIRYRYRRLYESNFFDYDEEGEFKTKCEARRNRQGSAVYEIYTSFGIESVIEFGKAINREAWVAQNLGKNLKAEDIKKFLLLCYEEKLNKDFFESVIDGFIMANGYEVLIQCELERYTAEYMSWVLTCVRPSTRLFEIAEQLLKENIDLYWKSLAIPLFGLDDRIDSNYVWRRLVEHSRFASAINLFGMTVEKCDIPHKEIKDVLIQAAITECNDRLDADAVRNLIGLLQQKKSISIEEISEVEMIYLLWLDEYSKVKPRALRYRLANNPKFFCELMELLYKKRHTEASRKVPSENMIKRLWELLHNFCVVPGSDWEGNYNQTIFSTWIDYCKRWGREEDREEIVLFTIGNGLSYARKLENDLIDDFIIKELNKVDNEEMREGYRAGIFNQRGVVWVDPEGKPEYELAQKYEKMAEVVEHLGYAKYAETLRLISRDYEREAEEHIRRHQQEQEARKRAEED